MTSLTLFRPLSPTFSSFSLLNSTSAVCCVTLVTITPSTAFASFNLLKILQEWKILDFHSLNKFACIWLFTYLFCCIYRLCSLHKSVPFPTTIDTRKKAAWNRSGISSRLNQLMVGFLSTMLTDRRQCFKVMHVLNTVPFSLGSSTRPVLSFITSLVNKTKMVFYTSRNSGLVVALKRF